MRFTFSDAFSQGSQIFKKHYGFLLGASLIYVLVLLGIQIAESLINASIDLNSRNNAVTLPSVLITIFFTNVFTPGIVLLAVQLIRGESPRMGTLFAGFSRYWPMVGIGVLVNLIFIGIILLFAFIAGFGVGIDIWESRGSHDGNIIDSFVTPWMFLIALCLMMTLFFFMTRLAFASILCIDPTQQLGVTESLSASWRLTKPAFWPLLGLLLILGMIILFSLLLLILPILFVGIPLCVPIYAAAYAQITGKRTAGEIQSAQT